MNSMKIILFFLFISKKENLCTKEVGKLTDFVSFFFLLVYWVQFVMDGPKRPKPTISNVFIIYHIININIYTYIYIHVE